MEQRKPEREFLTLPELGREWRVEMIELQRWLEKGTLRAQVWIPLVSVFESQNGSWGELRHFEGFAILSRHQCRRLFRHSEIGIRSLSSGRDGPRFLLPDTSDDVVVKREELVISTEERKRFEGASLRRAPSPAPCHHPPNFQNFEWQGAIHQFGPVQARCLELLHKAAQTDTPWLNGKQLLHAAGSQSFSLSNLFKRKPIWKELVESDGRGNYRMRKN